MGGGGENVIRKLICLLLARLRNNINQLERTRLAFSKLSGLNCSCILQNTL